MLTNAPYIGCIMSEKTRKIAVLTGDIVGSTALGPEKLERAFDALRDCAEMQAEWMGESLHFTRHRGDGWQVALAEPKYALRSALAFRAALKAEGSEFDSYIGIETGLRPPQLTKDLNQQLSKVFVNSGRILERLKVQENLGLRIAYPACAAVSILVDHIASSWTAIQARAALEMIPPNSNLTYTEVAKRLDKSRQSVTKTLDASAILKIDLALSHIESDESHV